MTSTHRPRSQAAAVLLAVVSALALAACDVGASGGTANTGATSQAPPAAAANGPAATPSSDVQVSANGSCASVTAPGVNIQGCQSPGTLPGSGGSGSGGGSGGSAPPATAGCPANPQRLSGAAANADFENANLPCATVNGTGYTNANFEHANLAGATLTGHFANANFTDANLAGVTFSNAAMANANFAGANLAGARNDSSTFGNANWAGATCPDGTRAAGSTCGGL